MDRIHVFIAGVTIAFAIATGQDCHAQNTDLELSDNPPGSRQKAIAWTVQTMNKITRSLYKEQVEDVVSEPEDRAKPYHLFLKMSESYCLKNSSSYPCSTSLLENPASIPPGREDAMTPNSSVFYVPLMAPLASALKPGQEIVIEGETLDFPGDFYIYLLSNSEQEVKDAHLEMMVEYYNLNKTEIWFTSVINGKRGDYEIITGNIVNRAQPLKITIRCEEKTFEITINGVKHSYKHRVPYKTAEFLSIIKSAKISSIKGIAPLTQRGFISPAKKAPFVLPVFDFHPVGHYERGIGIGGQIIPNAKNIEITLQTCPHDKCSAKLLIVKLDFVKKTATMSAFFGGQKRVLNMTYPPWFGTGTEKGQPFYMEIFMLDSKFSVLPQGYWRWPSIYTYEMPVEAAKYLRFSGDLDVDRITGLNSVRVCKGEVFPGSTEEDYLLSDLTCLDDEHLTYARFGDWGKPPF